ncbi:2,3-diaminopropionate biosynthesis protein SbnA [Litoribacter ruber]|uniref:2,3-diaminopropionate biosynthesis protein SbnA n=1 Tax=Litoribacter ruber TaxID=702568 RepID=UPI001BD9994C|nr:2,3-diaminopropionate biosynthesis protein SbnA [Litoribacter ruber]MBT0812495.1 2,3-diaminopropionate biosynthesis protein SbnA [Litoribacter ruber]
MNIQTEALASGILATIGHTPLVPLTKLFPGEQVFGKLEAFNPAGSIKDRTALNIIQRGIAEGKINSTTRIVESTSGNMGIGLAQICLCHSIPLTLVVDPYINPQTVKILKTYGAKVEKVTQPDDTGGYLKARLKKVEQLLDSIPNSFWPNQYANPANPEAHHQTVDEILDELYGNLDYLFVATSTCGTIMGCADRIHMKGAKTKVVPVDSKGSIIFGDSPAKRVIPGIGAGRKSQFLNESLVEQAILMSEQDSIRGCRELLKKEAILAGGSSGAIVSAIQYALPHLPKGSTVAGIICDRGERYLDTVYNNRWVKDHFGEEFEKSLKF